MILLAEIVTAALLITGGLFAVIGSFGLLRLAEPMQRLHAPAKATTIGAGTALIALACQIWLTEDRLALREILVALFFFVTAPLSALFLAKAHLFGTLRPEDLPPTGSESGWATHTEGPARDAAKS